MPDTPIFVAGLPVIDLDVAGAVDRLLADARTRVPRVYVFVNGYSATLRRDHPAYAALLSDVHVLPLADGAPLAAGSRLTGQGRIGRAPGPDVFEAACGAAAGSGLRIALVGGMPGTVEVLAHELMQRYPALQISLALTPPVGEWTAAQTDELIAQIEQSDADILWLGVSAPRQEIWAVANIERLARPVLCVGAGFDFLSRRKPRAPRWMRAWGLEWLFRLLSEPRRLGKRYLSGNVVFLADALRYGRRPAPTHGRRRAD